MPSRSDLVAHVQPFLANYNQERATAVWARQSETFRRFWNERVMGTDSLPISDADCDQVISILDRNAKGNTKETEAIARAMIAQGAWRRMFNELHLNQELCDAVNRVLTEKTPQAKADAIDDVYALNSGKRNYLTGPSSNALGALLAAFAPEENLSIISLNDREPILKLLCAELPFDWHTASIGARMANSNGPILEAAQAIGLPAFARTVSAFFYEPTVKSLWREQHTVKLPDRDLSVSIPTAPEEDEVLQGTDLDEVRESMQIQALLAKIGAAMGFRIWLPKNDRTRVLKAWTPKPDELLDRLPLAFDQTTMATIEQIDVLWLSQRAIVRAFEVEHTTSIYSGLLRMADLVALQPNIKVRLHIVAAIDRREKVLREIRRPVFSLLQGCSLREMCTYLSYDHVREIAEQPHLEHLAETVLNKFEESAEIDMDAI